MVTLTEPTPSWDQMRAVYKQGRLADRAHMQYEWSDIPEGDTLRNYARKQAPRAPLNRRALWLTFTLCLVVELACALAGLLWL